MMIMMLRRRVLMRGMKVKTTWVSVSVVCSVGGELAVLAELCSVLPDNGKSVCVDFIVASHNYSTCGLLG